MSRPMLCKRRKARLLSLVLGLALTQSPALHAVPPFPGTIFIDDSIVLPTDPTAFVQLEYAGQAMRTMYDRRPAAFVSYNAYLFDASFNDGLAIEIQVNPEFGSIEAARAEADRYAPIIGQLSTTLRRDVATVWIHKGVEPFGGGNNNLLIHTGQAELYIADGILEETFIHEAAHTSLDAYHAAASGWLAAQLDDPDYISTYAEDNRTREDVAETLVPYFAVRHRSDRISPQLRETILATIPNRIAYLNNAALALAPDTLVAAVLPASRSVRTDAAATAFAVMINTGTEPASECGISLASSVDALLAYQATDPTTNAPAGERNTPVASILPGASQTFSITLSPGSSFTPRDVEFVFDCANANPARFNAGLNTLLLSASSTPIPDIVALAATPSQDGIANLAATSGNGVFAVASVNLGTADTITASAQLSNSQLPLEVTMCETDPLTSACINPVSPTAGPVTTNIAGDATPTFGVFLRGTETIEFDPVSHRISVQFTDGDGVIRGATSVAVRSL